MFVKLLIRLEAQAHLIFHSHTNIMNPICTMKSYLEFFLRPLSVFMIYIEIFRFLDPAAWNEHKESSRMYELL